MDGDYIIIKLSISLDGTYVSLHNYIMENNYVLHANDCDTDVSCIYNNTTVHYMHNYMFGYIRAHMFHVL